MSATSPAFDAADTHAMQRALQLAARGLETTDPNPRVGCVLVQGGAIVGESWHARAGEAHAEVRALEAAGARARGATAYVTLEPCSHFGRTPPCTDALISAGIARVVFATEDPNPEVHGRGAQQLRAAGIRVEQGLCSEAAEELNVGFFKRMRVGAPFVRLKLAMSLDGRTALASGESRWITGEAARADVQRWRARSSAVITGIGTVLADDPRLDVRAPPDARQPVRVVLDTHWRTPATARLFEGSGPVLIFGAPPRASATRPGPLPIDRQHIRRVETDPRNLPAVLAVLSRLKCNELLVEAGAQLAGAFLRENLADELILYIAPMLLGPQARPLAQLPPLERLALAPRFTLRETQVLGPDLRLVLRRGTPET